MKKQFNLEYYLEHPETKVVTRDGHNARIICTDFINPDYPVVALVSRDNQTEFVECVTIRGELYVEDYDDLDLFFDIPDPEKKKVPLTYEDLLERVKAGKTMWVVNETTDISKRHTRYISNFDCNGVYYVFEFEIMFLSYQKLIEYQIHFADGTPCWKEVEE